MFCSECGQALEREVIAPENLSQFLPRFDPKTGQPYTWVRIKCPVMVAYDRMSWWRRFLHGEPDSHQDRVVME